LITAPHSWTNLFHFSGQISQIPAMRRLSHWESLPAGNASP
jgi:hypothetical protein